MEGNDYNRAANVRWTRSSLSSVDVIEFQITEACSNVGPTWATGWTVRGSNPGRDKRFFSSPKYPDRLWGLPGSLFNLYRGSFSGIKRLGHDFNHSPPSNAEVENERCYTSTPLICLRGVDRDNFTFFYLFFFNVPGPSHYRGFTISLRHTTVDKTPLDEFTSPTQRPLSDNIHNTHKTDICAPGGI